jgi:hypothetical protein
MAFTATLPTFRLPTPKFPSVDLDAVFALQKANLAVVREVQDIVLETAQALARLQRDWVKETFANAQTAFEGGAKNPDTALTAVNVAADRALAVARQGAELGSTAQYRVAELLTQRAAANVDQLKALAA